MFKRTARKQARPRDKTAKAPRHKNLTPGTVTALEPQVKRPNRLNLYVDNHFALGLSVYAAAGVRVGQELTREDLEKIDRAEQLEDARERALRFLETRPKSEQELRRHLLGKGFDEEIIAAVLARLRDVKLVSDKAFAKFWVENREGFKPRSARALQYELRQKGVPDAEIKKAVGRLDERESAYRAARPRALRWKDLEAREFREKLSGFLARRGFDYGITRETVTRLWKELNEQEPLEEDFEE